MTAFAAVEWLIAARYLRAKKRERTVSVISVISFLGIALGVATLIIVMSVMNGFRKELLSKILGLNGHVMAQAVRGEIEDYDAITQAIKQVPGVTRAAPLIEGQVMASANGRNQGALVRGMRPQDLAELDLVAKTLSPGALDKFEGGDAIIIGTRLMNAMGAMPGAKLTLIGADGPVTAGGATPRRKAYTVVGTFEIGMSEYDGSTVFMPFEQAQLFFKREGGATNIEIMIENPDQAATARQAMLPLIPPSVRVLTWQEINSSFFATLQIERNVMFLILSLIILVAALNIISGMIMLVKDKGRDIAILRTMGATRGSILRIFFIAGSSIGVSGTIAGLLLGLVFVWNIEEIRQGLSWMLGVTLFNPEIYFLSRMPAEMNPNEVVTVAVMALSLSFLATLYPAWRAARLEPVEALRYE
jgi:lipoprotein-releasing system permease protein